VRIIPKTTLEPLPSDQAVVMAVPLAELQAATMRYGEIVALGSTTMSIPPGTVVALVGSNGSGKSTLLGLLAGLINPSEGRVVRRDGLRISFVAQQHHHHRWMPLSVGEVIAMGRFARLGLVRPFRRADREAVARAAERLDVAGLMKRSMSELSGGQRQRVLVAQALVDEADLILLDEPITGLDLPSQNVITEVMAAEAARGASVVFSTHHLDEARRADRVVLLAGAVIADGEPAEVLTPELLAIAFGGRLIQIDRTAVVVDEHGHGIQHDDCDHLDPGR
jgi:ABC-type Mn2+/Zn2+ transport system ATPase subunit